MLSGSNIESSWRDFENQIAAAFTELRFADARALIEPALQSIPLDWQPIQERANCVIGAFWDEEEFLGYKAGHSHLSHPVLWTPQSPSKLWWLMASTYVREREYDLARVCLQNGYEWEPDHPGFLMAKGSILNWEDRFEEALEAYRAAVTIRFWTPSSVIAECYCGQGVALGGLNRLAEARDAFAHALELKPDDDQAKQALACVLHDLRELRRPETGGGSLKYQM